MAKLFKAGCSKPKDEFKINTIEQKAVEEKEIIIKKEDSMIKVGQKAPNFELAGYHKGEFKTFTLEEFRGKWVVLCFYPGDFTFV